MTLQDLAAIRERDDRWSRLRHVHEALSGPDTPEHDRHALLAALDAERTLADRLAAALVPFLAAGSWDSMGRLTVTVTDAEERAALSALEDHEARE